MLLIFVAPDGRNVQERVQPDHESVRAAALQWAKVWKVCNVTVQTTDKVGAVLGQSAGPGRAKHAALTVADERDQFEHWPKKADRLRMVQRAVYWFRMAELGERAPKKSPAPVDTEKRLRKRVHSYGKYELVSVVESDDPKLRPVVGYSRLNIGRNGARVLAGSWSLRNRSFRTPRD